MTHAPSPTRPAAAHAARLACALGLLALASSAAAHTTDASGGGFVAGFLHPLQGSDHLLAMLAVGIWGAVLGAPLLWALPVVFPLLMVLGSVLGIAGVPVPFVEVGIALSVLLLGAVIAAGWRAPVAVAIAIVAFFGALHGYAHGAELPEAASPAAHATGFVLSTGLLHLGGIALGELRRLPRGMLLVRLGGAAIAATGLWMLVERLAG